MDNAIQRRKEELERRRIRRMDELAWNFNRLVNTMDVVDKLSDLLPQSAQEQIRCKFNTRGRTAANRELSSQIRYRKNWYGRLVDALKEVDSLEDLVHKLSSDNQGSLIDDIPVTQTQRVKPRDAGLCQDYVKQTELEQIEEYSKYQPVLSGTLVLPSQQEAMPATQRAGIDRRRRDEDEKRDPEKPSHLDEDKTIEKSKSDDAYGNPTGHPNHDHNIMEEKKRYSKNSTWNQSKLNNLEEDNRNGDQENDRAGNPIKSQHGDYSNDLMNKSQPTLAPVMHINGSSNSSGSANGLESFSADRMLSPEHIPKNSPETSAKVPSETIKEKKVDETGGESSNVPVTTPLPNDSAAPQNDGNFNCDQRETRRVSEGGKTDGHETGVTKRDETSTTTEKEMSDEKEESDVNEMKPVTRPTPATNQMCDTDHLDNHEASVEERWRQEDYSRQTTGRYYSKAPPLQQAYLKELGLLNDSGQRNAEKINELTKSSDAPYGPLRSTEPLSDAVNAQNAIGNDATVGYFKTPSLQISKSSEDSLVTREGSSSPAKDDGIICSTSDATPSEDQGDLKGNCAASPSEDGGLVTARMENSMSQQKGDLNSEGRLVEKEEGIEGAVERKKTEQFQINSSSGGPKVDETTSDTSDEMENDKMFRTAEQSVSSAKSLAEKFFSAVVFLALYISQINTNEPVILPR